jgi:FMN phosphatase YigB (HAD superfamily)
VAKPDPAIYLTVCAHLGVAPTECFYVGDGADGELAAAASLGMSVVRTTEHNDTDPPGPDRSSSHADLLRCWGLLGDEARSPALMWCVRT